MRRLIFVIFYIFLLIENAIEKVLPALGYYDELITLVTVIYALMVLKPSESRFDKCFGLIFLSVISIVLIGLISNCFNMEYIPSASTIIKDIIQFTKMPIVFLSFWTILNNTNIAESEKADSLRTASSISTVYIIVCLVACILNLLNPMPDFTYDLRAGVPSFQFVYSHPTYLVFALVVSLSVRACKNRRPGIVDYIGLLLLILTFRNKAFIYVAFYIGLKVIAPNMARIRKYLILAAIAAFLAVLPMLQLYASFTRSPREMLYKASISIGNEAFPIGSGFGTFASSLSGEEYSLLNYEYGFQEMPGLSPDDYSAMGDAAWPYYISEFGYIGLVLFIILIIQIGKYFIMHSNCYNQRIAIMLMLIYILFSSFVEAVFTNPSGVVSLVVFFIYMGSLNNNNSAVTIDDL